jgi:DNA-binding NarL/FixJ family response regulator
MPRIVVLGCEQLVREAMCALLLRVVQGATVAALARCDELERAGSAPADLLVVDEALVLPGLRAGARSGGRCLALTAQTEPWTVRRLFEGGATGVISYAADASDLRAAVERLLRDEPYLDPRLGRVLIDGDRSGPHLDDQEVDLVRQIALGHTNAEIARTRGVSVRTVESYRSRVMTELGARSRADLVRWALDRRLIGPRRTE